jgi:hypothetical protein
MAWIRRMGDEEMGKERRRESRIGGRRGIG